MRGNSTAEPPLSARDVFYLRTPVLAHDRAALLADRPDPADGDERAELTRLVRAVADDPVVREALEVSSGSLGALLRHLDEGAEVRIGQLRRGAYAACRYLLRMTGRPTPFGLMAGVAVGGFADAARAELGVRHRKGVRPDGEWLAGLVTELETRTDVLRHLRVCANDLCFERGGRLVLPYVPMRRPDEERASERSVRMTPVARTALRAARTPVEFSELRDRIVRDFEGADAERAERLLAGLVETGLLRTELVPPQHCTDPLAYVLSVLERTPAAETGALRDLARDLDAYARAPIGAGLGAWSAAAGAVEKLRPAEGSPLQVDLRMDTRVALPAVVAREVESAASVLLRLAPPTGRAPHLVEYHLEFADRYGLGNAVPVKEVLDPERGLGPPAGYRVPADSRFRVPPPERDEAWHRRLGDLAARALLAGSREIVLDEATIGELATGEPTGTPPETAELSFQLLAESCAALDEGDFSLISGPATGVVAGAMFGRFAYLFPDHSALAGVMPPPRPDVLRAQLAFDAMDGRSSNLIRVPSVLDRTLALGTYDDRGDERVLGLDDVGIIAEPRRLALVALRENRRITVLSPQMLDPVNRIPNAARLLREISLDGVRKIRQWQWGDAECLPYLPRVRHGRTVLAPARWRPSPGLVAAAADGGEWDAVLDRWRGELGVPGTVQARYRDHIVEIHLEAPLHRRLFRDELRRKPDLVVTETARRGAADLGWLGGHANEIVVPLVRTADGPAERPAEVWRPATVRHRSAPGGDWVFAKLYSGSERHAEILGDHLPRLLREVLPMVDRWFFLRYADPEQHVRLRFHGPAQTLNGSVLPALHTWAGELCDGGLLRRLVLDTYEPEVDRYGGAGTVAAAERAFGADSEAVLAQLPITRNAGRPVPDEALVAVNFADLLRRLDPEWTGWYGRAEVAHYDGMHRDVRVAVALLDEVLGAGSADFAAVAPVIRAAWEERAPAIGDYATALRAAEGHTPARFRTAADSLLHMHHNRLIGTDPDLEKRAHAVASRVAAAYRGRARAGRR